MPLAKGKRNEDNIWTRGNDHERKEQFDDYESLAHLTLASGIKFEGKNAFGYRKILRKEKITGKGYPMKFLEPQYTWITHQELRKRINNLVKGFKRIGVKSGDIVCIYMETRIEWMILCQALFRMNVTIATLFSSLGQEGIVHVINETNSNLIITSNQLLPELNCLVGQLPNLKQVIIVRDVTDGKIEELSVTKIGNCDSILMEDLEASDDQDCIDVESSVKMPSKSDIALIIHTSGSTGIPKGVLLSHGNLINTIRAMGDVFAQHPFKASPEVNSRHCAYLPLAHIFELFVCHIFLALGVEIGFASPETLLETSPALMPGCLADMIVLKPEVMIAVPLMLDRFRKTVGATFRDKGNLRSKCFNYLLDHKMKCNMRDRKTPLIDRLIMKKIRSPFGGHLKILIGGGAQLSEETQIYTQNVLGVYLFVCYGGTESSAGTMTNYNDPEVGTVGPPDYGTQVKLIDWIDGGYRVTDSPNPRGEIMTKSKSVARGYFNRPEETAEYFIKDESDGKYWFKTGDIGEFQSNGCLKIIDRKKCLIKLQLGEYVSPGKIEAELKSCPIVDEVCVIADSSKSYTVALVIPNESTLRSLAHDDGIHVVGASEASLEQLCNDSRVTGLVLEQMTAWGMRLKLQKFEIPKRIKLIHEVWTPDSGLVTDSLKIRREEVKKVYKNDIQLLYSS